MSEKMEILIRIICNFFIGAGFYYFAFRRGYDKGYLAGLDFCINVLEKLKGERKDNETD